VLPFQTYAQSIDSYLSKEYSRCIDASGGNTANMLDCNEAELKRWDQRLNAVYKKVMTALEKERAAALKDAQKKWISFRNSSVTFYNDPNGGTMSRLSASSVFLRMTVERTLELEDILRSES
jgi:uncharacterized protein YecT (DUF1311 family)